MRLVTATLVVFGLLWGAEASNNDVAKVEKSTIAAPGAMARIITLIKGMKTEIIKDGKLEQQLFDKYQCWVERSVKESRETIAASEETLETMESEINRLSSEIASETEDIAHKVKSLAANEKSQADATERRNGEKDDFEMEINNDMTKMGALEKTLDILMGNKASTGGQDEGNDDNMGLIAKNMKVIVASAVGDNNMSSEDKQAVVDFAKAPAQFFQSSAGRVMAYENQSGPIIGIMKSMLLATASDAQERSAAEIRAVAAYQDLMHNLQVEHQNLTDQKANLEQSKSANELQMAENKTTQENTEKLLEETEQFLETTVEAGKEKAKEWALRSQLRLEELKNIDQGIAILSDIGGDDEQAFNNPGDGAFLQVETTNKLDKVRRQLASAALSYGSQDLTKLVAEANTGDWKEAMWHINEEIDRMIAAHKEQAVNDRQLRQDCHNKLAELRGEEEQLRAQARRANANSKDLKSEMEDNDTKISNLQTQASADQTELDTMNDNAAEATRKMRSDLGAREHAIEKIKQAIDVLGAHCAANSLVQKKEEPKEEGQYATDRKKAPKAEFSGANKHCQSTEGLISILQMVLQDLHNEATELNQELGVTADETHAQGSELRSAIQTSNEQIAELESQNADKDVEKTAADNKETTKTNQANTTDEQHTDVEDQCKIVLNDETFAKRQAERETEVEALNYAKTVLTTGASGNAGNEFMQIRAHQ